VPVLLHLLTPGFDHADVLKLGIAYMLHNRSADQGLILDLFDLNGLTYLVTADRPDCVDLPVRLAEEVGHAFAPEGQDTAEAPIAAPQTAAPLVGFTPFLGSIQSTSGTLSVPTVARPAAPPQPAPATAAPVTPTPAPPVPEPAVPLPAFLGAPQAPETPPAPEAPTVYVIAQPKAGFGKTLVATLLGFLVIAAVFWIAVVVVRGMK
jgi:hypothetical protein